jgi:predicted MFS family arabinose efflux permease
MVFAHTFCIGAFPPVMPEMARSVGLSDWQVGTVAGILGFARLVSAMPAGLLVTRHLRPALVASPFLLSAGVLCLASGWSFGVLVLGRFAMGIAHAFVMIGGLTAILRQHPARSLGAALNAFELSAMLGMVGGVTLVGSLPATIPWNGALLVACSPQVLGVLVLPFLLGALPRPDAPAPPRAAGPDAPAPPRPRRRVGPLVVLAFAAGTMLSTTWSTLEQFTVPLRATSEFGLERAGVARLFMIMQLCDIAMLVPLGFIADRVPKPRILGVVTLMLAAGTSLVAFGDVTTARLGCVLVGLGMAGWMLPLGVLRQETPPERIAWRTALYRVGVDGGIFLGPFLSGVIGRGRLGVLPAITATALGGIGLALLGRPGRGGAPLALRPRPREEYDRAVSAGEEEGPA